MLLLCKWGVYVIDRSFRVRRVQMRCIVPGCALSRAWFGRVCGSELVLSSCRSALGLCRQQISNHQDASSCIHFPSVASHIV